MPEKVLPAEHEFAVFDRELLRRGFRRVSRSEFRKDFRRLSLIAPRPRRGREAGFRYDANNLTVVVWTTWLQTEGVAREEDAGWILIKEHDRVRYFSYPLHRTARFLERLLVEAKIARCRVKNRPLCPECKGFMGISRTDVPRARFWACRCIKFHASGAPHYRDFDFALPPEAKAYLARKRKRAARYRKKRRETGKPMFEAMRTRKPWVVGKQENIT